MFANRQKNKMTLKAFKAHQMEIYQYMPNNPR